jgi:hypothetical protein
VRTDDRTIRQPVVSYSPALQAPAREFTRGMRRAGVLATLIVLVASALLFQNNIRAARPPEFTRGGPFPSQQPSLGRIKLNAAPTATPGIGTFHSSAVLTAPSREEFAKPLAPGAFAFPTFGTYVYKVSGWEETTAFGRRDYPPEMQMTIHRPKSQSGEPELKPNEVDFDLSFSTDHEEREVVAYGEDGIAFTYEAGTITFGPGFTRSSEAAYEPPMTQIPAPLREGTRVNGTSDARSPDGTLSRTEDWTIQVLGQEILDVLGKKTVTWVVRVDRQSRPGTAEQNKRTRTYWFDPNQRIWVKWTESMQASQEFGPGAFSYQTEFTATLDRIRPSS